MFAVVLVLCWCVCCFVACSWNRLHVPLESRRVGSGLMNKFPDVIDYLSNALPPSIQTIQLGHNELNGTFDSQFLLSQANISYIYLNHNALTLLRVDLFNLIYTGPTRVIVLDLSFNARMTGTLPRDSPTSTLRVLSLHGCPLLKVKTSPPQLPRWLETSTTQFTKNSLDERHICPALSGSTTPLQFTIDPTYYNYAGCQCDQGTYGVPPQCQLIPVSVLAPVDPTAAAGFFGDAEYGSSRMSLGIDTAWSIGLFQVNTNGTSGSGDGSFPSNATTTATPAPASVGAVNGSIVHMNASSYSTRQIVAIYITITVTPLFSAFEDIIDIYQGQSLQTVPIVTIRGNHPRPFQSNQPLVMDAVHYPHNTNTTVTLVVWGAAATVNFRSRETSGEHMRVNYTLSADCPPQWYYDKLTARCQLIPAIVPVFELSSSISTAIWIVAGIVFTLILITFALVAYFRDTVILRAASVPFCLTMLLAAACLAGGSVLFAISPERGDYVCDARIWLSSTSLVLLLSCLVVKANRIRDIFSNEDMNAPVTSNGHLARIVTIMVALQFALLIGLTASDLAHPQTSIGEKATNGFRVYTCSSIESAAYQGWLAVQLAYVGIFLAAGLYLAYSIRAVPTAFNDSSHIVSALYVLTLLSVLLVPLNFIVDDNPNALALIRGLGQSLVAFSLTVALFGQKLYIIADGRANDHKMVQTDFAEQHGRKGTGQATSTASRDSHSNVPSERRTPAPSKAARLSHQYSSKTGFEKPSPLASPVQPQARLALGSQLARYQQQIEAIQAVLKTADDSAQKEANIMHIINSTRATAAGVNHAEYTTVGGKPVNIGGSPSIQSRAASSLATAARMSVCDPPGSPSVSHQHCNRIIAACDGEGDGDSCAVIVNENVHANTRIVPAASMSAYVTDHTRASMSHV